MPQPPEVTGCHSHNPIPVQSHMKNQHRSQRHTKPFMERVSRRARIVGEHKPQQGGCVQQKVDLLSHTTLPYLGCRQVEERTHSWRDVRLNKLLALKIPFSQAWMNKAVSCFEDFM
jgi:hypothetical protein